MSIFRLSDDPEEELEIIDAANAQWERAHRRAAAWNEGTVATVGRWAGAAPWVEPNAMLSLAENGVGPDSPAGREIATTAGADYYEGWRQGLEPYETAARPRRGIFNRVTSGFQSARAAALANGTDEQRALADPSVRQALEPTAVELVLAGQTTAADILAQEGAGKWGEYTELHNLAVQFRQGLAETFGQEWVDEQMASRAPEEPESSAGAARSAWMEPVRSGQIDPTVFTADAVDAHVAATTVRDTDRPNPLTSVARPVFMALYAPVQESVGAFRTAVGDIRRGGWLDALNPTNDGNPIVQAQSESDFGVALGRLAAGEDVDVGSGYFVDPRSAVARERVRRELSHGTINGEGITVGRWFADTAGLDRGDTFGVLPGNGYDALSGAIDFGVQVYGDPLNIAAAEIASLRRARLAFSGGAGSLGGEVLDVASRAADDIAQPSRYARAQAAADEGLATIPRYEVEEAVGALPRALVPDLRPETVSGWLMGGGGRQLTEAVAAEPSVTRLMVGTNFKWRPQTYAAAADASTIDEVLPILFDELSLHGDRGARVRNPLANRVSGTWTRRALSMAPAQEMRFADSREFVRNIYDMMTNSRVSAERLERRMRDASLAIDKGNRVQVFEGALDDIRLTLIEDFGVDEFSANALTRHITQDATMDRAYAVYNGEHATDLPDNMVPDGQGGFRAEPKAQLWSEFSPQTAIIPNSQEIRRITGAMAPLGRLVMATTTRMDANGNIVRLAGEWQNAGRALQFADFMTTKLWKPSVLIRPAYAIRQVIDETLRAAAAGVPTFWNHPIHYLGAAILDAKTDQKLLAALDQPNGGFFTMREFQQSMMQGDLLTIDDARRIATDMWNKGIDQGDPRFVAAWGRELGQLAADPTAVRLAKGVPLETVVDDLFGGELDYIRTGLGDVHPQSLGNGTREGVRTYVESVERRLAHQTGANQTLRDAVANGYLAGDEELVSFGKYVRRGEPGSRLYFSEPGRFVPSKDFQKKLATLTDSAPLRVKVEKTLDVDRAHQWADAANRWVSNAFNLIGTRPINRLSRAPAFRFFYFDSLADRMAFFTREAQDAIIEQAGKYHVTRGWRFNIGERTLGSGDELLTRLENARANGVVGDLGIDHAQTYGTWEAMQKVEHLLGDFSRRGQVLDAMRVITPFGNAWREAMTAYGRLLKQNPLVIRRPARAVDQAIDSGIFAEDSNGQMVFTYPASRWLMAHFGAAPFPLTARAQGLTMGFEMRPGFGPVVAIPAAAWMPDKPSWDGARDFVIPYGAELDQTVIVPEWLEKLGILANNAEGDGPVTAGAAAIARGIGTALGGSSTQADALWNGSVIETMTYLVSTGEYGTSTAERDRLIHDARRKAMGTWLWRALAQTVVPSAPRPNGVFEVGDGQTILMWPMLERLHELRDEDPLNANQRFLAEYGDLAWGILVPKGESSALYTPYDEEGYDWLREHENLMDRYPEIGSLFAPSGGGPAGIGAYLRRIERGDIETVSPQEWFDRGQDALASIAYDDARDRVREWMDEDGFAANAAVPEAYQDWLREEHDRLMHLYPGAARSRRLEFPEVDDVVVQLEEALATEDVFRSSDAGVALAEYLDLRRQAIAEVQSATDSDSLAGVAAAPLRSWLIGEGERLVMVHPDFVNLWDRVFAREVEEAEE